MPRAIRAARDKAPAHGGPGAGAPAEPATAWGALDDKFNTQAPVQWRRAVEMRPNALRDLMKAGKGSLGSHVASPWPSVLDMARGHRGAVDTAGRGL